MEQEFNIGAVIRATGLNEHTLRAWERRYAIVEPKRGPSGRRIYTANDISRLQSAARLVDAGHAISMLAPATSSELEAMLQQNMFHRHAPGSQQADTAPVVAKIRAALPRFDLTTIYELLKEARHQFGARSFVLHVIAPLIQLFGTMVSAGSVSIAQEHALSAIVKAHLFELLFSLRRTEPATKKRTLAFATMSGDLHEIGLLIGAVLAATHRWQVQYIGPDVPAVALGDAAHAMGINSILLSVTPRSDWRPAAAKEYLATLVRLLPAQRHIWIGGHPACLKALGTVDRRIKLFPDFEALERQLAGEP